MSDKHDDGGTAFIEKTLRDEFAGLAMQSCLLALYMSKKVKARMHEIAKVAGVEVIELMAKAAYQQADAMIAERKRERA